MGDVVIISLVCLKKGYPFPERARTIHPDSKLGGTIPGAGWNQGLYHIFLFLLFFFTSFFDSSLFRFSRTLIQFMVCLVERTFLHYRAEPGLFQSVLDARLPDEFNTVQTRLQIIRKISRFFFGRRDRAFIRFF